MKERPILFKSRLVRAILSGDKIQTRRVIKRQPFEWEGHLCYVPRRRMMGHYNLLNGTDIYESNPFGQIGDSLYVRETFCIVTGNGIQIRYRADGPPMQTFYPDEEIPNIKWIPSIHMKRIDSRIDLGIINVRVERLKEISRDDAIAEGIKPYPKMKNEHKQFRNLGWNTYGEQSWRLNPWVWVIDFKLLEVKK